MPLSALLDLCAGLRAALDEGKQAAYFVERKAEFAAAQDEAQAGYVVLAINAVAGGRARRVRHHTDFLVIADGFQIAARKLGQVSALHSLPENVIAHRSKKPLESVVPTERSKIGRAHV